MGPSTSQDTCSCVPPCAQLLVTLPLAAVSSTAAVRCQETALGPAIRTGLCSVLAAVNCMAICCDWQVHGNTISSARTRTRPTADIALEHQKAAKRSMNEQLHVLHTGLPSAAVVANGGA